MTVKGMLETQPVKFKTHPFIDESTVTFVFPK